MYGSFLFLNNLYDNIIFLDVLGESKYVTLHIPPYNPLVSPTTISLISYILYYFLFLLEFHLEIHLNFHRDNLLLYCSMSDI